MINIRSASGSRGLAVRIALVLAGSVLLALSAKVAVPMIPVPITLQTLALPVLVFALGRNLAVLAAFAYLLEGALGVPVFAPVNTGPALIGPTAGYLWMYPVAAYITGTLAERGWGASYAGRWLAAFAGTVMVFAGGVWWLAVGFHLTLAQAFAVGVVPFIIGDVLKCTIAAGVTKRVRLGS